MARAFVLGNGPSLRDTPLRLLRGEVTFAMNRIKLLYDSPAWGAWRPTYYFAFDMYSPSGRQIEMVPDILENHKHAKHLFVRADRAEMVETHLGSFSWPPRITYHYPCSEHMALNIGARNLDPANGNMGRIPTSWHLPKLCAFGSTLNIAVQVAVLMGFSPIYLLGCDLGFVEFKEGEPDPNHFSPDYIGYDDFPWSERDATLRHMHKIIAKEVVSLGKEVVDLTPVHRLDDIYPSSDLAEVL